MAWKRRAGNCYYFGLMYTLRIDWFCAKLKRAASADLWLDGEARSPPLACRIERPPLPLWSQRISLRIHSHINGPGLILAAASHESSWQARTLVARWAVRFPVSASCFACTWCPIHHAADVKAEGSPEPQTLLSINPHDCEPTNALGLGSRPRPLSAGLR